MACQAFVRALAKAGLELPSGHTRYVLTSATERTLSEAYETSVINPDAGIEPCSVLLDVLACGVNTRLQLDLLDDDVFAEHLEGK